MEAELNAHRRSGIGRTARRGTAGAAALTALVLLLTGCSTAGGSGSDATGGSGGGAATAVRGVSADAVKVGYTAVDVAGVTAALGFKNIDGYDAATTQKAIEATVAWVNANGGVAGRRLDAVVTPFDGQKDSPELAESTCRGFTQDAQVFAVVIDSQYQNNARPCYASQQTVMLDQTRIAIDGAELQQYAPYLWLTSGPDYSRFLQGQLAVLQQSGWFTGSTGVGVLYADIDAARRSLPAIRSYLQQQGITNVRDLAVDTTNVGTLGSTSSAAIVAAQSAGVDRLFVVGGARILGVVMAAPEAADFKGRLSVSTLDSPNFFVDNPEQVIPEKLVGMAGAGFLPAGDLRLDAEATPFPDPSRPNEVLCKQIIDGAGVQVTDNSREGYRALMQHCDATLLFKAAGDKAGANLTPETFRDAMWSLGTGWSSALLPTPGWPTGSYAAVTQIRGMFWDGACRLAGREQPGCFRYGTAPFPLP